MKCSSVVMLLVTLGESLSLINICNQISKSFATTKCPAEVKAYEYTDSNDTKRDCRLSGCSEDTGGFFESP